ncbi:MAG: FG-GAP-like repeat-containing protein, partial [Planctomycetota bacterium]
LATGIATYDSPVPIAVGRTSAFDLRDLNNAGQPDLIAATQAGVALLLGNGNGTFQPAVIDNPAADYAAVAVLNIDQTGGLDVVATNSVSGTLDVFLNACDLPPAFTVTPPTSVVIDSGSSTSLTAIAGLGTAPISSTWQRDGVPIAGFPGLSGEDSPTLSFAPAAPFQSGVFENVAGNAFGQSVAGPTVVAVRPSPGSASGDVNNDGSEDFFDVIELLRLIDQSQD